MVQPGQKDRSASKTSGDLYGRDYFLGKSSGYPAEGYGELRDNWKGWLSLISQVHPPPGVFVDLGSAYGYLVSAARQAGYKAFGCDISSYALHQESGVKPMLAQADVHHLPFPSGSADIVSVFDLLEHLNKPQQCLAEAVRILKPSGLLIGTTPDPIFFDRKEETHCFERPPSFWLALLRALGMVTQFRFSVDAYNFQFVAANPSASIAERLQLLQHDYFSTESDFIAVKPVDPAETFHAVPRFGWGPLKNGAREIDKPPASIYLLNTGKQPLRAGVQLKVNHSPDFSTLRIRLDGHVLEELHLTSELLTHSLSSEVLIPAGGHHLFFDLFPGGPETTISNLRFEITPASSSELTLELPFDLQQRYRLAGEIVQILGPKKVLDVGGYLGDRDGHLAVSGDFLRPPDAATEVVTTDLRHCDHPSHHPSEASEQPFPSASFDLVASFDVLEHIPEDRRADYLGELDRLSSKWILLGAPFSSKTVEALETSLAEQLDLEFLKEHRQLRLPSHLLVEDFFVTARGYSLKAFPNGHLPVWGVMQLLTHHLFSIKDHRAIKAFNRLYAQHIYPLDQRAPSYRTVYLVSKGPIGNANLSKLDRLIGPSSTSSSFADKILCDPGSASVLRWVSEVQTSQSKALSDVQFLINERQRGLQSLKDLNAEIQSMPLWKVVLKRIRRRLSGRPVQ